MIGSNIPAVGFDDQDVPLLSRNLSPGDRQLVTLRNIDDPGFAALMLPWHQGLIAQMRMAVQEKLRLIAVDQIVY